MRPITHLFQSGVSPLFFIVILVKSVHFLPIFLFHFNLPLCFPSFCFHCTLPIGFPSFVFTIPPKYAFHPSVSLYPPNMLVIFLFPQYPPNMLSILLLYYTLPICFPSFVFTIPLFTCSYTGTLAQVISSILHFIIYIMKSTAVTVIMTKPV